MPGYKVYRQDQSANKGGVLALIKSDVVHSRVGELENTHLVNGSRIEIDAA